MEGFAFTFLVGFDKGFASFGGKFDSTALAHGEVAGLNLLAVDEGDGEAVSKPGAEFFHEVEGKGRAVGTFGVKEADEGVKTGNGEGTDAIVSDESVKEGKEAIDAVEGGLPGAAAEEEVSLLLFEEVPENGEIDLGGSSFDATEGVEITLDGEHFDEVGEVVGDVAQSA